MNKATTLVLVFFFYFLAFWLGFMVSYLLVDKIGMYFNLFIATSISTVVIYIISLFLKNASIYDPYWSIGPFFLIFVYYFLYNQQISFGFHHLIVLIPLIFWGIRLTGNWISEFTGLNYEDWRYIKIKGMFKNRVLKEIVVFFGIMFVPTVIVYFATIPLFTSFLANGTAPILFYILGAIIILGGTVIEFVADDQMQTFREQKLGTNINSGLWKYSRHPNYLGEILVWIGVFVASLNNFKVINLVGPVVILGLFLFISIPMNEKRYLTRYETYLDYKKSTSMLIPLPKKNKNLLNQ